MVSDSKDLLDILAPDGNPPLAPSERGVFLRLVDDDDRLGTLMALLEESPEERWSGPEEHFAELAAALRIHVEVTEKVVYPALAALEHTRAAVVEARSRQEAVKKALDALHGVTPDSEAWQRGIGVLGPALRELLEVETKSLIPAGERALSQTQVDELAGRYRQVEAAAEARSRAP